MFSKEIINLILTTSFIFLTLFILISIILLILIYTYSSQNFFKEDFLFSLLKFITYLSLLLLSIIQIILWFFYFEYNLKSINLLLYSDNIYFDLTRYFYNYFIDVPLNIKFFFVNYQFSIDLFGLVVQTVGIIIGYLSFIVLDTRFFNKNIKYLNSFSIFSYIVLLFTTTNNVIFFFFFYELLLLPSFLLVYFLSQARKATQASLYFVIWTQIGSFLVLCAVAYLLVITNKFTFYDLKFFKFTQNEIYILFLFFFLGFGFKVPIWPFHFWLTKTHVESPAGFSMYLSGFLVKTALYGFYKYTSILGVGVNTTIFVVIAAIGVIDASIKMFSQADLKKLVAFCTVQEMNMIYLMLCWGDSIGVITAILFTATHAFLSALMFFLVDCIQRRYNSRSLLEISGIIHITPNLGIALFFMSILYSGIPGTMKFVCEFYLYGQLLQISFIFSLIILFFANFVGVVAFCRCWYNVIFGMSLKFAKLNIIDLSAKELYLIFFCFFFLIFIPLVPNFFF